MAESLLQARPNRGSPVWAVALSKSTPRILQGTAPSMATSAKAASKAVRASEWRAFAAMYRPRSRENSAPRAALRSTLSSKSCGKCGKPIEQSPGAPAGCGWIREAGGNRQDRDDGRSLRGGLRQSGDGTPHPGRDGGTVSRRIEEFGARPGKTSWKSWVRRSRTRS